jgi:hypothetical protein
MSVIPATWEAEIGKILVPGQSRQKSLSEIKYFEKLKFLLSQKKSGGHGGSCLFKLRQEA